MRSLQTALDVAKQQGATLLQLRAALSMASAAAAQGRAAEGLEPLRTVCAELPAEFDLPDLDEARRLLAA
jgi:predicted ATPase